jgi:hypothetical protein
LADSVENPSGSPGFDESVRSVKHAAKLLKTAGCVSGEGDGVHFVFEIPSIGVFGADDVEPFSIPSQVLNVPHFVPGTSGKGEGGVGLSSKDHQAIVRSNGHLVLRQGCEAPKNGVSWEAQSLSRKMVL